MESIPIADSSKLRGFPCDHCFHQKTCLASTSLRAMRTTPSYSPITIHQSVYQKRQRIIDQSATMTAFYIVKSGSVKSVHIEPDGEERITAFHLAGESAGWEGIQNQEMPSSIVAMERTVICRISISAWEELANRDSSVCKGIIRNMGQQLNSQNTLARWLAQYTAEQRVTALIEDLSARFALNHMSDTSFRLPMNRTDIANYLGLAVETVSRCLSRLQQQGDITIRGKDIRIYHLPPSSPLQKMQFS